MRYADGVDDQDLYALLGLTMSASAADLKRGRRLQAQRWHPDRNRDKAGHRRMAAINNAFRVLSDPSQREEYDQALLAAWKGGSPAKAGDSQAPSWVPAQGVRTGSNDGNGRGGRPAPGTATAADFLRAQGFSVVDNRATGGVLWVVATPRLEPVLDTLRERGLEFEYAATGGMATDHQPAFWTRGWG